MTLKEAYQQGKDVLVKTGTPDADLDAWLLLEHVSKISRAMYYAVPDKPMTQDEESQYLHYIERRAHR